MGDLNTVWSMCSAGAKPVTVKSTSWCCCVQDYFPSSLWRILGDYQCPDTLPSLAKMWGANLSEGTPQSLPVIRSLFPLRGSLRDCAEISKLASQHCLNSSFWKQGTSACSSILSKCFLPTSLVSLDLPAQVSLPGITGPPWHSNWFLVLQRSDPWCSEKHSWRCTGLFSIALEFSFPPTCPSFLWPPDSLFPTKISVCLPNKSTQEKPLPLQFCGSYLFGGQISGSDL